MALALLASLSRVLIESYIPDVAWKDGWIEHCHLGKRIYFKLLITQIFLYLPLIGIVAST